MNLIASRLRDGFSSGTQEASDQERLPLVRQYMRLAIRWRFLILGSVAASIVLGLIVTFLMTPKYTAVSVIEIARESNNVTNIQGVERETSVADQEFYQTQYGLLRARSLSERVARELQLVNDPKFFQMFKAEDDRNSAFQLINGSYVAGGRAERQRIAGEVLLDHVGITPERLSRLVNIGFTSPDPVFSARVSNAWGENFLQSNLERKVEASSYGRDFLQKQLKQLKQRLDESQRQLVGYASSERIINLPAQGKDGGERSIVADDLAALNASLSEAIADRIAAQARFEQTGRSGVSTQALSNPTINSLRQKRAELAADYQRLMTQFQPEYPAAKALKSQLDQIEQSLAREDTRVQGYLNADFRQAQQRENELQSKVDELKSRFLDMRGRSIQYNIYQQEVDSNRALYDGLLQRFKEIGVAGDVGVNNVSIVDTADVPQKPSSPRLMINLLVSLAAGLLIGGALAFAFEQIDESIDDPTEVQRRLGLPLLGTVPKVSGETPREALLDRKSELVDAYLAIHTNLRFTTEHGVPRSLSVTSTRPAEGKSTSALSIATTLARLDRKVILIDGDMRSPSVHHLGGVGHDFGLSNFLAGNDDIEHLVFKMEDLGITAMSAGPIPPNAAELLTGNRLSILIDRLLEEYDNVVIDSPPVMGLADAPLIGSRVEGVIYAVESHGIRSTLVRAALARLQAGNAHLIGGILTKFESRKASYGYGYNYDYGYGRKEGEQD